MSYIDTPIIEYKNHPAFSSFISGSRKIDSQSTKISAAIEAELVEFQKEIIFLTQKKIEDEYSLRIIPLLRELRRNILDSDEIFESNKIYCSQILTYAEKFILKDLLIYHQKTKNRKTADNKLITSGFSEFTFDTDQFNGFMLDDLKEECAFLQKKGQNLKGGVNDLSLSQYSHQFKAIERFLNKNDITKQVSDYLNRPSRVNYVALINNSENEIWWKNAYKDIDLEDGPFTYYHYDFDPLNIKCIFYLSEVTPINGPFKCIKASYHDKIRSIQHYLYKCVDRIIDDDLNSRGEMTYYRKKFLPEFREQFANLPEALRGSSHFGDDILPQTKLAKEFEKNEEIFLSKNINALLFDGSQLMHRGGLVDRGSRWVIQVGFCPKGTIYQESLRNLKRIVKGLLPV